MTDAKVKCTVFSGMMIGIGVLLPQIVHLIAGQALGSVLLPMHIPVFLTALLIGAPWAAVVAVAAPMLSFMTTGMPPVPMLFFMIAELLGYAVTAGILYSKKVNVYFCLIAAMLAGRAFCAAVLLVLGFVPRLSTPAATTVFSAIATGLPGIVLQVIIVPAAVKLLERAGFKHGFAQ